MTEEQARTLQGLKTAIRMEIDGKEFYLKAADASRNTLGKELLNTLAAEEDIHRQVFEKIYDGISKKSHWPTTDYAPDYGRKLRTVFAEAIQASKGEIETIPSELEAVQKAMDMENETYDFYEKRLKEASYDAERAFYEAVAAQEKEHHSVLLDYYEFLKDPAAWYVEKEHPSLDGG